MTPRTPVVPRLRRCAATVVVLAAALAGCGTGTEDDADTAASGGDGSGAFPVTIEHKYGETTIEEEPKRVVSIGYQEHDTLYALGVEPVAVRYWYGPEDDVIYPWAEDAAGDADPEILNMVDVNFEAIAKLRPDLIVGMYSGIAQADYDKLSQIAPTVTQTDEYIDYGVPWQVSTRTLGKAVGREDRAEEIVDDLESRFDSIREEHPEWADLQLTVATGTTETEGGVGFFASEDPRTRFFTELGFQTNPELDEIAGDKFYGQVSGEQAEVVDADVVVWDQLQYVPGGRQSVEDDPIVGRLPAVRDERVVWLEGETENAYGWQSPLSIPFALDAIEPLLEDAATKAQAPAA